MNRTSSFAYMQARIQARHGMRPEEQVWQRLRGTTDLANYLHAARNTTLAPWVTGLHATHGTHEIEHALRQVFRDHVERVAHWLPSRWDGTIHWLSLLPDLPAIQHLLNNEAAPAWMLNNPRLRPYTSENMTTRMQAMLDSSWHDIVEAWQDGQPPVAAWLERWQGRWPGPSSLHGGMRYLSDLLRQQTHRPSKQSPTSTPRQRERLVQQLQGAFRRYTFQPAAACAHLGLVAVDLERLRAELVSRALFADIAETGT